MYINFWYPVAASNEVSNEKPLRVRILCTNLAVFRDQSGNAHVLSDTCIHRGGALGAGKVVGDCLQCPYHGWQYDGNGKCILIPALGEDEHPPARAKVDSYPVQEKYGIVFAFLGDLPEEQRPPLLTIDEFDDKVWRANILKVFEVDYYYERSIENGLDPAHNEFVHPKQGTPGMKLDFKTNPIQIDPLTEYGSGFMMPFSQIDPVGGLIKSVESSEDIVQAGSGHVGPNSMVTWLHFSPENQFHQYFFEAPIDEGHTRIFFVNMRRFMMDPAMDQKLVDINMEIAQEDIDVLVKLNPVQTPETLTKELLIATDKPVVRYRELLKDWENRGWRIDMDTLVQERGNRAYAIPSPQRRTDKNWVLDPLPLV